MLWCGDFYGIHDVSLDYTSRGARPPLHLGLYDVWRCYHASERDYTFYSDVHKSFSKIDMFLVNRQSLQVVDRCEIDTISWSDHAPITLLIHIIHSPPVPFMWKNNTFLLAHQETSGTVSSKLEEFFSLNSTSISTRFTLWNAHKAYIRGVQIQISSR